MRKILQNSRLKFILILVMGLCFLGVSFQSVFASDKDSSNQSSQILFSYLEGKRAACMTGTPQDGWIRDNVKTGEVYYYNTLPDELLAMSQNKVDYLIIPTVNFNLQKNTYPEICQTEVVATEQGISYLLDKSEEKKALMNEINAYIAKIKESGKLEELQQYWLFSDETKSPVDLPKTGEKGILKLAATSSLMPYMYKIGEDFAGFELDILASFCKENGYGLEVYDMDFSAIISSVLSGKYDLGCSGISATEERRKSANFCDYTYVQSFQVVMRAKDVPEGVGIAIQADQNDALTFGERLYNNFIAENRWQMYLKGGAVTIGITILAALFGTILGYFICRMRISNNKFRSTFARGYNYILSGMPQVLLLMIFCFIIFGNTNIIGFWVAVIAFTVNFSAIVAETLRSGIDKVDNGQREAGLTLGYTEGETFSRIILPQAVYNCFSEYKGQIIALLKATSIVGYIAVQDVTKVADIIRSRTFDAFIPLIFAAIVYFVLAAILIRLLGLLDSTISSHAKKTEKKKMLKGVILK